MANEMSCHHPIAGHAQTTAFVPELSAYTNEGQCDRYLLSGEVATEEQKKALFRGAVCLGVGLLLGWAIFKRG